MKKITLGIVDDSSQLRTVLTKLLNSEDDFEVIVSANNGSDLLEKIYTRQPDVILMDIRMPIMDGIETTRVLFDLYPQIKIIVLTQHCESDNIIAMYRLGVNSFIGKDSDVNEVLRSIRVVDSGGNYMTKHAALIIQNFLKGSDRIPPVVLKESEKSLIKLIMEGYSSKEIGSKVCKSSRTIEDMRQKLYLKFNVENKEQLIALASKWDLSDDNYDKSPINRVIKRIDS